jgi:hypothetical protein
MARLAGATGDWFTLRPAYQATKSMASSESITPIIAVGTPINNHYE